MTYGQWIKAGGCAFSHFTEAYLYQCGVPERTQIRDMELKDVLKLTPASNIARRELISFVRKQTGKLKVTLEIAFKRELGGV